ncbi:MAG: AlpA family transcriptional regulator [Acidobacteria bacterium]|nr:AlpA family transcriptional regulator [Acidobacteriota bacterium]
MTPVPFRRLLRLPEVQQIVPLSRSAIYQMIAAGVFPKPIKIGSRASAWIEHDVQEWIGSRASEQRAA